MAVSGRAGMTRRTTTARRPDTDAPLSQQRFRGTAQGMLAAIGVHGADHLRRGIDVSTHVVLTAGAIQALAGVIAALMVFRRHRLAPVVAVFVGFAGAIGFAAAHLLPHSSAFSDPFTGSAVAPRVNLFSWFTAVRTGLSAFLDACLEPEFRRIVVLDSVPVLSQEVWDGGIEHNELPMLRSVLTPLVETYLPGLPVEPLVYVALGGLYAPALYVARSPEPSAARAEPD